MYLCIVDADWPAQPAVDAIISLAKKPLAQPAQGSCFVDAARAYVGAIDRAVAAVVVARKGRRPPEEQAKQLGSLIAEGQAVLERFRVTSLEQLEHDLAQMTTPEAVSALSSLQRATAAWKAVLEQVETDMVSAGAEVSSSAPDRRQLRVGDPCPPFEATLVCPAAPAAAAPAAVTSASQLTGCGTRPAVLVFLRHFG